MANIMGSVRRTAINIKTVGNIMYVKEYMAYGRTVLMFAWRGVIRYAVTDKRRGQVSIYQRRRAAQTAKWRKGRKASKTKG